MGYGERTAPAPVRVRFTGRAARDIRRLYEFVAVKNPPAAERLQRRLLASIRVLGGQPEAGRLLERGDESIREWIADEYVVHYRADERGLLILRIWHGKESR